MYFVLIGRVLRKFETGLNSSFQDFTSQKAAEEANVVSNAISCTILDG